MVSSSSTVMKFLLQVALILTGITSVQVTAGHDGSVESAEAISRADDRQVANFPPPIKQALKQRMRENLAYVQEIQTALATADFTRAAEVAEYKLGLSSLGPHNARQAPYMPAAMRHLGMGMHSAASRFAVVAQEGDIQRALEGLAELTAHCVACHATYRAK